VQFCVGRLIGKVEVLRGRDVPHQRKKEKKMLRMVPYHMVSHYIFKFKF
jgi:hypothetical protein